eukprot:TRINITY_DN501_c0_g1_i1.p2 TRINITY_DN501_c0_g1~~TRINITY_DN501_c0_g1_i1.p2  ORF type:complete len:170 (-),score=7.07 TRINITY_DN501_c0_g1_i1:414-923(-)
MSQQRSLPPYNNLEEDNNRTDRETEAPKVKATVTVVTQGTEQVSGYPVAPPVSNPTGFQGDPTLVAYQTDVVYEQPMPCGCGLMWTIFILGFLIGGWITWWIGVFVGISSIKRDKREKPGFIANFVAAVIGTILFFTVFVPLYVNQSESSCQLRCHDNGSYRYCEKECY